ncbi:MAG: L28 family ribosomal protein [Bacilli bacterium]
MSKKATTRKPLFGNRRSHALNTTKHAQKLNMQKVTLPNGKSVILSAREAKKFKKDETIKE